MSTDRRSVLRAVAATGTTAVLGGFAGCATQDEGDPGGDGESPTDTGEPTATEEPMATDTPGGGMDATVQVQTHETYGDILVDAEGLTLYLFTQDEDGESVCYDGCAQNWPPLTVEDEPTAGEGVTAELGTTERDDGSTQVTAAGWPLYYFAPDENPGDVNGQGANDVWYVLAPDGSQITGQGASGSSGDGGDGSDGSGGGDGNGGDGGGGDGY